ncbi:MAG TPA: family 1 glycosylhydrolase [Casimicrobiaceae bacterium]|nr:family 1 glycosylhydrolase [Casimicrobiaceae bacterium]
MKPTVRARKRARLELWGGVEPTQNRVGNQYFSQLERSGHHTRASDLERCAELGIRTLRYPVLWERTMPEEQREPDWRWTDARLARLRELGIAPIAGLLHHGSGPRYTSLVDPDFPRKLADYAGRVAARYPWIDLYTPVNEPLTTARFSALYGLWYPHARCQRAFTPALLLQCKAVALAMQAIRRINPDAALVQTDDLGKTYSTRKLAYQAEFANELRWLTWDLLAGKVDRHHALWSWLQECGGASASDLMWFVDHPCPPDIVGVNHYVTSDRFLTENVDAYAHRYRGGNDRDFYADVEAARCLEANDGIPALLDEAWNRYLLPIAVTEAHIDATREDQLRWIVEVWRAAEHAREGGADIRAVTLWALFGTFDWNCLVTQCRGYYEPGAFDVRTDPPRATAIASLAKSLARGTVPPHPLLDSPGWWKRPGRFFSTPVRLDPVLHDDERQAAAVNTAPVLITGATGTLGRAFARLCKARGIACRVLSRDELDIADAASIQSALERYAPWAVVNAAGYVRVDDAERDAARCFRENTLGPEALAVACRTHHVALVTFSSDLVFDGSRHEPYVESDAPAPLNVYGRSKAEAESRVLAHHPDALVVRTSAFFGPWDEHNHVTLALQALHAGRPFRAATDLVVSPTYVPDLVNVALDLLVDGCAGIWHLSNGEPLSWADLALRAADVAGVDAASLVRCKSAELSLRAPRPRYSALASVRAPSMPSLTSALERYAAARSAAGAWRPTDLQREPAEAS